MNKIKNNKSGQQGKIHLQYTLGMLKKKLKKGTKKKEKMV